MLGALVCLGSLVAMAAVSAGRDALRHAVGYRADLTTGSGDFSASDDAGMASFYAPDGYHLVDKAPGWALAGVAVPRAQRALAVELTVRAVAVPGDAAFGPFVWNLASGGGYGFTVDRGGAAKLVEVTSEGEVTSVSTAAAPALRGGSRHVLTLTCIVAAPGGRSVLAGYVDGTRVVSGRPGVNIAEVSVTGMGGYVGADGPAEWVVSRFVRLGPDAMPRDAPSGVDARAHRSSPGLARRRRTAAPPTHR